MRSLIDRAWLRTLMHARYTPSLITRIILRSPDAESLDLGVTDSAQRRDASMKALRTGTLAIALLALGVTGASAGGLGERGSIKDGPYVLPTYVWSGLYVGGAVGYG